VQVVDKKWDLERKIRGKVMARSRSQGRGGNQGAADDRPRSKTGSGSKVNNQCHAGKIGLRIEEGRGGTKSGDAFQAPNEDESQEINTEMGVSKRKVSISAGLGEKPTEDFSKNPFVGELSEDHQSRGGRRWGRILQGGVRKKKKNGSNLINRLAF